MNVAAAPARIPATIVTGFLGAGKTTLIRNLIAEARGRRIAIIVNEFGDMGFDGSLLSDCGDAECRPDTVVELANGCICCTVADEFLPTMEALLARDPAPDHIVIETSGLALPQPLVRAFSWPSVRHRVTVDGVVTVVDAAAFAAGTMGAMALLGRDGMPAPASATAAFPARFKPSGTGSQPVREALHDDPVEELFEDQLRCADLIIVNKTELISEAELISVESFVRREARPGTAMLRGSREGVSPEIFLGISAETESDMSGRESHHDLEGEDHDHDDFISFVVDPGEVASLDDLRARVTASLAVPGVLRIKGRVSITSRPVPAVIQAVGPRLDSYFAPGAPPSGLVVIGLKDLDQGKVMSILKG